MAKCPLSSLPLSLWQHLVFLCSAALTFFRCWNGFYEDSLSNLISFNSYFLVTRTVPKSTNILLWHVYSAIYSLVLRRLKTKDCYCWSRCCSRFLAGLLPRVCRQVFPNTRRTTPKQRASLIPRLELLLLLLQRENLVFHAICGRRTTRKMRDKIPTS